MGNGQSLKKTSTNKKRLLVVGMSYSGFQIASQLWDYFQVTIIDQNNYFEHIVNTVKCAIDDKYFDSLVQPLYKTSEAYKDKFTFKQARLVLVNDNNSVDVETIPSGSRKTLYYDYLVLCTGSSYNAPIKNATATDY